MRPWWEAIEGLLDYELSDFEELAESHELISGPENDQIAVRCTFESRRGPVELVVLYPDSYPFLRPLVLAQALRLPHHQNPFERNLCLLDRDTRQWHPKSDTAASHIRDQLDKLFTAVDGTPEERAAVETPQAEPLSAFIENTAGAVVFIPDQALRLERGEARGSLRLAAQEELNAASPLRALLIEVATKPSKGPKRRLARADQEVLPLAGGADIVGRWLRVDLTPENAPDEATPDAFIEFAKATDSEWWAPQYHSVAGGELDVLGLVYREEVLPGEEQDAWLFVVRVRRPVAPRGQVEEESYLVKGQRLSRHDVAARIPQLASLADKTAAVIGLGALGAPLALELARAQIGTLRLLDWDQVEAGNSVRWPLGLAAAGYKKTAALAGFATSEYPLTRVEERDHQLGVPSRGEERRLLTDLLTNADLVIGVTAEYGIDHLLTCLGADLATPQVYAWGTPGYWGGGVARVVPGETGCWYCLKLWQRDKVISTGLADPAGQFQPPGCASPTATGAAFDLLPVVAQATRLAVQTMLRADDAGYPESGDDVMIMSLRTEEGPFAAPKWESHRLEKHPDCPYCEH